MAKAALPRLRPGAALLTLTYLGAVRSVPNYNTMGLAKASLEASVRYLAAEPGRARHARERHLGRPDQDAGRLGHQGLRQAAGPGSPPARRSGRNVTIDDVGNVAAFLLSDLAAGVSAEITYVDGGFSHVMSGAGPSPAA